MADETGPAFSHLGICVSDLERSTRFYEEALGFTVTVTHEVGQEFARLMDLDEVVLRSRFLRKGDATIELLAFERPAPTGPAGRRPVHQLGLTHLSFRVRDVEAAAERIAACGGTVVEGTATDIPTGGRPLRFVYCTDPDGTRIELMDLGG